MKQEAYPVLEDFLNASDEVVAAIAPRTLVFAAGGTRRAAALAGVPLEDMAKWTQSHMRAASQLCFRLGVHHLLLPVAMPQMFQERGLYREKLLDWLYSELADSESCDFYKHQQWRVHMIIAGTAIPQLEKAVETVNRITSINKGPSLWLIITPDNDELWQWQVQAFARGAKTRAEAIGMLYGETIPPVDVLLSYGKPTISLGLLPPLLYDDTQCYWLQKPGYNLSEETLRTIFYDYAYTRHTWRQDKTGRAEQALAHREAWEQGPIVGVGIRLGPFWYPQPFALPGDTAVS